MTRPVLPDPRSDLTRPVPGPVVERLTRHVPEEVSGQVSGQHNGTDLPHLLSEAVRGQLGSLHVERAVSRPCSDEDRFVTLLVGRVRRRGESLGVDIATAGHPQPYVVRSDGGIETVPVGGVVAGLGTYERRPVVRVSLGRLDTLFCYTDGTTEARGADGFFGAGRSAGLLPLYGGAPPEALVEAVDDAVVQHLDGRQHDDIALFALHRERG